MRLGCPGWWLGAALLRPRRPVEAAFLAVWYGPYPQEQVTAGRKACVTVALPIPLSICTVLEYIGGPNDYWIVFKDCIWTFGAFQKSGLTHFCTLL